MTILTLGQAAMLSFQMVSISYWYKHVSNPKANTQMYFMWIVISRNRNTRTSTENGYK